MIENTENPSIYTLDDILNMDQRYRVNLINTLTGIKSVNLIASKNKNGISNLAVFNSLAHIGAKPPCLGFIMRPLSVERHTYENIKSNKYFTVNQISKEIFKAAHHSSAKYPRDVSEFDKCNLTEDYQSDFPIAFVKESKIKIACSFVEEHQIKINDTILMVGKILKLIVNPKLIKSSGHINHQEASTMSISGLDEYYDPQFIGNLGFERPRD